MPIAPLTRFRLLGSLAILLMLAWGVVACGSRDAPDFLSKPKAITHKLDARQTKLLDLRLEKCELTFRRVKGDEIMVTGNMRVRSTDRARAELEATKLDLEIQRGGFTMLTAPIIQPEDSIETELEIAVPSNVNLRVVIGRGSVKGEINPPLVSDFQVLTGDIVLTMPNDASAHVHAESNFAERFEISGFDRIVGNPIQQLTHWEYEGQIGSPMHLFGCRLEARVNVGGIVLQGRPDNP